MTTGVSRRLFLSAAAAGISQRFLLRGQDATFSTDVSVVNVLVTVRDNKGHIVSDLTKDDFTLNEEGRSRTIEYFSRETNLPLTLGLLVDTSLSQRNVLGEERTASRRFIEKVLREDRDQTFLIHFDHDTELLQDLTNSKTKLEKGLDELELPADARPQLNRRGGGGFPGGSGRYPRPGGGGRRNQAGTTMYDAIFLASDELLRKRQGRKALILLTDGVDNGSKTPLNSAIESAQRSDTLVYSILFAGEEGQGSPFGGGGFGGGRRGRGGFPRGGQTERPDGKRVLQQISRETGGGFFEVSKKQPIDDIYDRIEEELRNQYSLGFTPDKAAGAGFRRIAVTVKRKGMTVQTREGYYPGT